MDTTKSDDMLVIDGECSSSLANAREIKLVFILFISKQNVQPVYKQEPQNLL